jgi:fermentation-respiration switch protein FrsA (DUF1100 family)
MDDRRVMDETPADYNTPYEEVTVTNAAGMELAGWYIPSENGAVILAQHGYKSNRQSMLQEAEMLHRHGYGVLISSIRAHDVNEGEIISFGYYEMEDMEAWYQFLLEQGDVDPEKIGILGSSLGGSLSIQYAQENENIKAIVAHSPFSSIKDTAATSIVNYTSVPGWLAPLITPITLLWGDQLCNCKSDEIDAKEWIDDISPRPIFLLDAGQETVVSDDSTELLLEAAGEPKEYWHVAEAEHAAIDEIRPEEFEQRVVAFFDQYLMAE